MTISNHPNNNTAAPATTGPTAIAADGFLTAMTDTATAATDDAAKVQKNDDDNAVIGNAEPPIRQPEATNPSTWAERFDPNFPEEATNKIDVDKLFPANISDPINAISLCAEKSPELAISVQLIRKTEHHCPPPQPHGHFKH